MITLRKYINYYKIFRGAVKTKNLVKEFRKIYIIINLYYFKLKYINFVILEWTITLDY